MNFHDIKTAIQAERIHSDEMQRAAERTRDQLIREYAETLERTLTAAALLANFDNASISISTNCFAAPWKKSYIHANLTAYLVVNGLIRWDEISPTLELLETKGFDIDKWTTMDEASSFSRYYTHSVLKNETSEVMIIITASLKGDNDTCKRVVVGYTKPEERPAQPIYEIRCGE